MPLKVVIKRKKFQNSKVSDKIRKLDNTSIAVMLWWRQLLKDQGTETIRHLKSFILN